MEIADEVYDFWASKDLEIDKLIRVGGRAHGLSANAVRGAAIYVYERKDTLYQNTWINAWKVFEIAKHLDAKAIDAKVRNRQLQLGEQYLYTKKELQLLRAKLRAGTLRYRMWAWFDKEHGLPHWE